MVAWCKLEMICTLDFENSFIQIMAKSLVMAKYVRGVKIHAGGMKNRKSPNRGLTAGTYPEGVCIASPDHPPTCMLLSALL